MSLTRCKECGKEISKDAEICPNCGKKQEHFGNQIVSVIQGCLTLYILYLLYSCASIFDTSTNSSSVQNTQPSVQSENIVYEKVSLADLQNQLEINAARAQQIYKGKYIEFQGPLDGVDSDGKYFTVDMGNTFISGNHCTIHGEHQKKILIGKDKGDIVFVKGKVTNVGEIAGYYIDVIELR